VNVRTSIFLRILAVIALLSVAAYMSAQVSRTTPDLVPTGKGWGEAVDHSNNSKGQAPPQGVGGGNQCPNGICYHGGPVMGSTPIIYVIWYGNWSSGPGGSDNVNGQNVVRNFLSSLSGTPYENINKTYSISGTAINGMIAIGIEGADSGSQGTSFGDAGVQAIVASQFTSGALPKSSNALYMVLTSSNVNETSGFCTQYCGWHTHGTIGGTDIKYAFVGNPDRCPASCSMQVDPNGYAGADGMVSIIAHEQEEAISDPDLNAWYDKRGMENADKCAWTFGTTYTTSNGSTANVNMGGHDYLIQRNWVNASGGYCSMF
jgi:hypothetical protein